MVPKAPELPVNSTRQQNILGPISSEMRVIEVGPSHNPIAPKSGGWLSTVIDHATRDELVAKYATSGVDTARIETVDYVWDRGSLADSIPKNAHGSFDALIASHVIEHLPDLVGFLISVASVLKTDGIVALAVPDKRFCFDHFRPVTLTGDLLAAHVEGEFRHNGRTAFNHVAYSVSKRGSIGWNPGDYGNFQFAHSLQQALASFRAVSRTEDSPYQDYHSWQFTPASFELVILELNFLGIIPWGVRELKRTTGMEFYVWLGRQVTAKDDSDGFDQRRLALLETMMTELSAS
jgi:SAM-dependent methyltransferase